MFQVVSTFYPQRVRRGQLKEVKEVKERTEVVGAVLGTG